MEYKLPRGIISHNISDSFYVFLKSLLYRSRDQSKVEEFELELSSRLNAKFCKSFGLARTAIYFILKYLNHPPGTKILLSPITIKGILDVVVYLGYEPVYLDIDDSTYVPSIDSIEGLDSDIKVAIITPLYGVIPDIENISKSLKKKDIFSLLDFSHCFDAKFKNVQILWASTREPYNFLQAKKIGCHIITVPPEIIEKIEKFGQSFNTLTLSTVKSFLEDSKKSKFKI